MTLSVLVVDDDASIRDTLVEYFQHLGHVARGAETASQGRQLAQEHAPDVVLLDLRLPDADGLVTLEALKADDPDVAVILLSGFADVRTAVRAMHHGAADVLEKPVDLEVFELAVLRAAEPGRLRRELSRLRALSRSGDSSVDQPLFDPTLEQLINLAARNIDAPVLLQGETGTGKGYVAHQIHDRSAQRVEPFIEINCASLSAPFFESELFGHERGAFTDAKQAKRGLLEVADRGTLFLDEIVEMAPEVQARFLKVIEERRFRRMGGTTELKAKARVIVASNQLLTTAVADQRFRSDLYYRLQVLTLTIPPLRARPNDLMPLAYSLLPRGATLDRSVESVLREYQWPGNIRELKNTLWRAAILADGAPIHVRHLGLSGSEPSQIGIETLSSSSGSIHDNELKTIRQALAATNGNRTKAAKQLGIARSTLLEKIKRYSI